MTDYGHELEFGLFPTPSAEGLAQLLELEVRAADLRELLVAERRQDPGPERLLVAAQRRGFVGVARAVARTSPPSAASSQSVAASLSLAPPPTSSLPR